MFRRLENIINSVTGLLGTASETKTYTPDRRGFMRIGAYSLPLIAAAACDCGGDDGGSGDDPVTPKDKIAPGQMNNLESYASVNNGEEARLRWVSSGDDDWIGSPDHFIIAYSANPIATETDWQNATLLASMTANGPSGTQYDEFFNVPAGDWYFAIKAVDEAGNESLVSNSPNAAIKTKAEFYVDKWLAPNGFNMSYGESSLVIRGDAANGIISNADALAQILINSDDQNGVAYSSYATWQDIRDELLRDTDGILLAYNSELIDATNATQLSTPGMGFALNLDVVNPLSGITEQKVFPFLNMSQNDWDSVHNLYGDALKIIVAEIPENYGGSVGGSPDPSFDPDW
ncbi:MAG: hypothetical protein KKE20_02375 [Nanoarchaeota archaeon]|nr:hypothetical protein [Nanoarchaeota archaeon]